MVAALPSSKKFLQHLLLFQSVSRYLLVSAEKETTMILDLVLSVILTFGASGPSNNFNECPPADQPDTVAAVQVINTTVDQA